MNDDNSDLYVMDMKWPALSEAYRASPYQVSGLAIDSRGHILALTRGDNDWFPKVGFRLQEIGCDPVLVLDKSTGAIMSAWGKLKFVMPHQIRVDREGFIWIVDCGAHKIFKFDADFNVVMELGGRDAGFNMPTDIAVSKDGSFFVSDGYVNARVAHFDPAGELISSWGKKGDGPLEFRIPHSIALDQQENIWVADRENDRIQILDRAGKLQAVWSDIEKPSMLFLSGNSIFVLSHLTAEKGIVRELNIFNGSVITSFPTMPQSMEGDFEWPHGMLVTDNGKHIYIGYTLTGKRIQRFIRGD